MHVRFGSGNPERLNRTKMAEPDKDDLADALSRLASGEAPSAPEGVPSEQVPLTPKTPRPQRPQAPGGPAAAPPTPPPATQNPGLPSDATIGRTESTSSARPSAPGVQPPMPRPMTTPPVRAATPKPPKPVRP